MFITIAERRACEKEEDLGYNPPPFLLPPKRMNLNFPDYMDRYFIMTS